MKLYEIGTGYTPIPAQMGAATEIVVEGLTRAFQKLNVPVEIIDIKATGRADTDLPIQEVWVPACFFGTDVRLGLMHKLKRVVYSLCLTVKLRGILKNAEEQTVLHFHNQYNLFFFLKLTPAKLRQKALIAYTNHSGIWRMEWKKIKETVKKRYFQEAACMKNADIVFLLNQETKTNVIENLGVPEDRVVLIGNGVDTDAYHPLEQDTKVKFGLEGKKVILQVGSVNENKGQLRSLQTLLPILKAHPNLIFAYAGGIVDEMYQQRVLKFANDNSIDKQVRYLGMVEPGRKLNQLYNAAELTMLPSQYEGFSLVTIESCAAGVPVLVQRQGPVQIGEGSIFYDATYLTDMLEKLLYEDTYDLNTIKEAARHNVVTNYSWNAVAADYAKAFRNRMNLYV